MPDTRPMKNYEILWSNGYTEMIEAQYVEYPSYNGHGQDTPPQPGYGHIRFHRNYEVIASAREGNLISVREIPITVLKEDSESDKPTEDKASGDVQEDSQAT